jgi:hypothetical protein
VHFDQQFVVLCKYSLHAFLSREVSSLPWRFWHYSAFLLFCGIRNWTHLVIGTCTYCILLTHRCPSHQCFTDNRYHTTPYFLCVRGRGRGVFFIPCCGSVTFWYGSGFANNTNKCLQTQRKQQGGGGAQTDAEIYGLSSMRYIFFAYHGHLV